ncbi:hypothetical protein GA0061074_101437 [Weissella bombi]|uniref:MucBP domain-containing protein n=2 Tax=Weissella bombi TaxID=1505725 RepID=A0A1C3ZDF0_9LACO|nr:hypothetical protein GA0061074_101437 [Weissella bombi]
MINGFINQGYKLHGNVGDSFISHDKQIPGYKLVKTPVDGIMTNEYLSNNEQITLANGNISNNLQQNKTQKDVQAIYYQRQV